MGFPFLFSGNLTDPGIKLVSTLQVDFPLLKQGIILIEEEKCKDMKMKPRRGAPFLKSRTTKSWNFTLKSQSNPAVSTQTEILCISNIFVKFFINTLTKCSAQFCRSLMSDSATPWTAALQASLSITSSRSLLKLMSIELVMLSNHLIFDRPLLLLPSIFPSTRVFSNESVLCIRWPREVSASASVLPMNIQD